MMMDDKHKEKLQHMFPLYLVIKENRIIIKPAPKKSDARIVIPSSMFPLIGEGEMKVFSHFNTESLNEPEIFGILDLVEFKRGKSFENSNRLFNALKAAGVNDLEILAGWKFLTPAYAPVHHCCLLYKSKYILDLSSDCNLDELTSRCAGKSGAEARKITMDFYKERFMLKHSERIRRGTIEKYGLFIGRNCDPAEGEKLSKSLLESYPDHISFKK